MMPKTNSLINAVCLKCSASSIEYVHGGHIGGPKQKNDIPLGNKCYFYANIFNCFGPTWPPCTYI